MNSDDFTRWGKKLDKAGDDMMGTGFGLVLGIFVIIALIVLL
jgi:hypothetical protein